MGRTLVESRVETTPYSWYVDPAVAAAERESIFRRSWQYAGHTGELAGPGSFFPTQVGGLPVIVVLDREGDLRGYLNICRHRGTILVNEPQKRGTIQCPYHAWTYGLDGALRGAPRSKEEPDFDADGLGLAPVQVDTWGPFVFVNPDLEAAPLADTLGDLPTWWPRTASTWTRCASTTAWPTRSTPTGRSPWRTTSSATTASSTTRTSSSVIDEQAQRQEHAGLRLSQFPPLNPSLEPGEAPYDVSGGGPTAQYHILFPAMKFNVNPGRPNLSIGPMWPVAHDRTSAWFDYFFAGGHRRGLDRGDARLRQPGGLRGHRPRRGGPAGRGQRRRSPHGRLLTRTEVLIGAFQELVRGRVEPSTPLTAAHRSAVERRPSPGVLEGPLAAAHALAVLKRLELGAHAEALGVRVHHRADLGARDPAVAAELRGGGAADLRGQRVAGHDRVGGGGPAAGDQAVVRDPVAPAGGPVEGQLGAPAA